jgi:uncharacterized protein YjbI with pentapeptide repeats
MHHFSNQRDFEDEEFSELQLDPPLLTFKDFRGCTFRKCNFQKASFEGTRFLDCTFEGCDLSLTNLSKATFKRCVFSSCRAVGFALANAVAAENLRFEDCNLRSASLVGLDLRRLKLTNCIADDADFTQSNLTDANFQGTSLAEARFFKNDLSRADFRSAKSYAFDPATCKLAGAKFSFPEVLGLLAVHNISIE